MGDLSKNFSRVEFACNDGCGFDTIDAETLQVLEAMRQHFRTPITINSGCRCPSHNRKVGGASNSQHLYGRAVDVVVSGINPPSVAQYLETTYPGQYGIGRYATFTHLDTRTNGPSRWRYA
jgi:uncharacterized protein YcbK (DUF882 family)